MRYQYSTCLREVQKSTGDHIMDNLVALFPLKGKVTKEIIEVANITDPFSCRGARTLRTALENAGVVINKDGGDYVLWARHSGIIQINGENLNVYSEGVDLMSVLEPMDINFTLTAVLV